MLLITLGKYSCEISTMPARVVGPIDVSESRTVDEDEVGYSLIDAVGNWVSQDAGQLAATSPRSPRRPYALRPCHPTD